MYSFQVEPFQDCVLDAVHILEEHWEEIAENKDLFDHINPDLETYLRLEKLGMLKVITVRLGTELVGYFLLLIKEHAHYKHVVVGVDDLYFVSKKHRKWGLGIKFLKYVEAIAKEAGCQLLVLKTKHNRKDLSPLFFYLDYNPTEIVFTKKL